QVGVTANTRARAISRWMGAVQRTVLPFDFVGDVELTKGRTAGRKREKGRADVVEKAGQSQLFRIERSSGALTGLQHQDIPAVPCQLNTGYEAIRSRANDDGIDHAWFQPEVGEDFWAN